MQIYDGNDQVVVKFRAKSANDRRKGVLLEIGLRTSDTQERTKKALHRLGVDTGLGTRWT